MKVPLSSPSDVGGLTALAVPSPGTFQSIAQVRANALARYGRLTHNIHVGLADVPPIPPGVGEGIGYSTNPDDVPTCVLSGAVVADARATSSDGRTFRVRFFQEVGGLGSRSDGRDDSLRGGNGGGVRRSVLRLRR